MFSNEKNQQKLKHGYGFTLLELLTSASIFLVIFAILIGFVIWIYQSNVKIQAIQEVSHNSQQVMQIITGEIKRASSIYTPATNASQLSLETASYLPADETASFVDFFICGTQICFKKEGQAPLAITSDKVEVQSLNFSQIGTSNALSIRITLTISHKGKWQAESLMSVVSTAGLRSY